MRQQSLLHPEAQGQDGDVKGGVVAVRDTGMERPQSVPAIEDYRAIMAQRAVFQSLASMGLPAFTIHSIVRYSGRALKNVKNVKIRTWGPIGVCLSSP